MDESSRRCRYPWCPRRSRSQVMVSARAEHGLAQQASDVAGKLLVETRSGSRIGLENAVEVGAKENAEQAIGAGARLRRTRRAVDQREVAEEVTGSELGQRRI